MTRHLDERLLNDFREGFLEPQERELVQAHLEGCPECRRELDSLSKLAGEMAALPVEASPARDLWPQIAWRMEGSNQELPEPAGASAPVEEIGSEKATRSFGGSRQVSFRAWQLVAASIALMVISGASVWAVLSGRGVVEAPAGAPLPMAVQAVDWEEAYGGYEEAVADLESVLERGREILDPETVRVLEESLRAIDLAIEEAGEAVRRDPASPVLQRFLAENLRKKMDLLRKAATAVYANT